MMLLTILSTALLAVSASAKKPNIVFLLSDDQDLRMNSLDYMYGVQHHLMDEGATYMHHYCTVSLCCPSRTNLWTGRCAHNTNITSNGLPGGGWEKFVSQGLNDDWLFPWMQKAGYQTYFVGKLINGYGGKNYNKPLPKGFNGTAFLSGKGTYNYYKPTFQRNKDPPKPVHHYSTYAIGNYSLEYLDQAIKSDQPFFLAMTPIAPHDGYGPKPKGFKGSGPVPAEQYVDAFSDVKVPRTVNFNPDVPTGVDWVHNLPQLNASEVAEYDEYYRNRIRALQSVDDVVNSTIAYLAEHDLLNNTYFIYSTDNGFHIGQHRLTPGKNMPFEEDVNVPMIIRGPGIKPKTQVNMVTSHTDMAATILHIAGADLPSYLDGAPLPVVDPNYDTQTFQQVGIEHWGSASQDEIQQVPASKNSTYKALRIIGEGYDWYYSVWCDNEHELYDMSTDIEQMRNLFQPWTFLPNEQAINTTFPINRLESRLNGLMLVLKSCKATTCTKPWEALHPQGDVLNLLQAMSPKYDQFYEQQQPRVSFNYCSADYVIAAEGPQLYHQYGAA